MLPRLLSGVRGRLVATGTGGGMSGGMSSYILAGRVIRRGTPSMGTLVTVAECGIRGADVCTAASGVRRLSEADGKMEVSLSGMETGTP